MSEKSSQPPSQTPRNNQALSSLALGALALLLSLLALVGTYQIGAAAIVAALLSFWAGGRGLLDARQRQGIGLPGALGGAALGLLGLVVGVAVLVSHLGGAAEAQVFQSSDFTMRYPANWRMFDLDAETFCSRPDVDCLLAIGIPGEETRVQVFRYTLSQAATVEAIDESFWEGLIASNPQMALDSREALTIGGLPAIKRLYHLPVSAAGTTPYTLQIYAVRELTYFEFRATFPNVDDWVRHRATVDAIAASMRFRPLESASGS